MGWSDENAGIITFSLELSASTQQIRNVFSYVAPAAQSVTIH
jgi:hypothetical protein